MFLRIFLICISILPLQKKEPSINWSTSNTLSWTDFKAAVETDSKAVAITASGITFGYSIKKRNDEVVGFHTKIEAHFYPNKSWVKIEQADKHILAHEQFHFNITELFARKFRQRVAQLQVYPNVSVALDTMHQEINQELADYQELYDAETDFSRNKKLQLYWQNHIEVELDKLDKYKL